MPRNTLPNSILKTRIGNTVLGSLLEFALWLGTVPTTIQLPVTLDFPDTAAQTSSDLIVTVKGVRKGDGAMVAYQPIANSLFTAEVTDKDEVTIRFHNYSAAPLNPDEATFNLYVFHQ